MYSPKIRDDIISRLYQEAKSQNKPMTKLVNEIIENYLLKAKCRNCQSEIILDEPKETAYCSFCECEVFVERVYYADS